MDILAPPCGVFVFIPVSWVLSSAGRASPLQGEGRGFDPLSTHHLEKSLEW